MRILIVTPHFYPESFKCNDVAFELLHRGFEVEVMTAIPDYPIGHYFKGYGIFKRRREIVKGVKIYRSFIIPRGKGGAIRLSLNYISYTIFSSLLSLWIGLTRKYDAIFVYETSPIMVGIPAVIMKKMQHIPLLFWVQDLWPESLSAAGGIRNKRILSIFEMLTTWIYKNSDKILISSKGFKQSICNKGNFAPKIDYFPNWIDAVLCNRPKENFEIPSFPTGFIVMMAGNMGDAQDLPNVLQAAYRIKDHSNIHFVFVGEGRKKSWVESYVQEHELGKTVHCLGRFPLSVMPNLFYKADVLLLSLKDSEIFSLTVPSRLQAYMYAGKPIVAMINGEGERVVSDSKCGYSVRAGDYKSLADLLIRLSEEDKSVLQQMGLNGKLYSQKYYDFDNCIDNLVHKLHHLL